MSLTRVAVVGNRWQLLQHTNEILLSTQKIRRNEYQAPGKMLTVLENHFKRLIAMWEESNFSFQSKLIWIFPPKIFRHDICVVCCCPLIPNFLLLILSLLRKPDLFKDLDPDHGSWSGLRSFDPWSRSFFRGNPKRILIQILFLEVIRKGSDLDPSFSGDPKRILI